MRSIFLLTLLLGPSLLAHSQTDGNAGEGKTYDLDEIVVKAKNAWIEDNKYVFVPQRREKNLSRTMEDLVRRMHTGILRVEDDRITTQSGQAVNVFINGVPADNLDRSTFWARNALRVEYMESSDDPRFLGATNIVNFVMRDYTAGGLTKLDADQQFPNDGRYSAASKLVWGKMTYNAMLKGTYSRDHQSGTEMTETYDGIYYGGTPHERVTRREEAHGVNRSNGIYAGFNARYRTERAVITHSVALQWDEDPGSLSRGTVAYSPAIIGSDMTGTRSSSRSLSPSLEGLYSFTPSRKWTLAANWTLSHSHNNALSAYEDSGLSPILTTSRENVYNIGARLTAVWSPSSILSFQLALQGNRSVSDTDYAGEVASGQWQGNGTTMLQLMGWWRISNSVSMRVTPQLTLHDRDINHDIRRTELLPGVNAALSWMIDERNGIALSSWYYLKNPSASQGNDLILRSTELRWIEGNPYVGSSSNYWLSLDYTSYPASWMSHTLSLNLISNSDESCLSYRSGGTDYDGVIGQYRNAATVRKYMAVWDLGVDLLGGALRLGNQLSYSYQRVGARGLGKLRTRPYVAWDFGDCSLSANYGSPEKFFSQGGALITRTPAYYNLDFSYGNGNFIFDLELSSPFHRRLYTESVFNSGPYHYTSRARGNGRSVSVSLTYTFDYGRRVTPGVEISDRDIRSSSVLGSE